MSSAGLQIVREALDKPRLVSFKGATDLVTETDKESELAVLAVRNFPSFPDFCHYCNESIIALSLRFQITVPQYICGGMLLVRSKRFKGVAFSDMVWGFSTGYQRSISRACLNGGRRGGVWGYIIRISLVCGPA